MKSNNDINDPNGSKNYDAWILSKKDMQWVVQVLYRKIG